MKNSITFLFFLFPLFSKALPVFDLNVYTGEKIAIHGFYYWNQINIASNDTNISATVSSAKTNFCSLKPGDYTITITSRFGNIVRYSKKLGAKRVEEIKIKSVPKFYSKSTAPYKLVSLMKLGDTLHVLYSVSGNPLFFPERIMIVKIDKGIKCYLYTGKEQKLEDEMNWTDVKMKFLADWENSSKNIVLPKAACTTISSYTIMLNKKYYSYNDYSCSWNGFYKLKKDLFTAF